MPSESEAYIGEWAESKGIRDQLFIATKYTNSTAIKDANIQQKVLLVGNSVKSMQVSVKESLKRLRADYIDLFYIHWWDYTCSIQEVMHALHGLVLSGKVLYLGISDAPAWIVAKANQYARDHALTPFSVYQGQWSILERSFERDIIPMARDEGIALAPWGVLGGGKIRTDAEEERRRKTGEKGRMILSQQWERTETEKKVSKALEKVAEEIGAKSITAVAIAYVMHKTTYVFPIIGGRKVENLVENLGALEIALTEENIKFLDSHVPLELGFPYSFIGDGGNSLLGNAAGYIKHWPRAKPISPANN
ncbi:hypothetical protein NMY22_g18726 [Coprinellus aureogranulatus]|nr:hypothetical protein NMY22_g18726 [Coprinellus aureogranulatus]